MIQILVIGLLAWFVAVGALRHEGNNKLCMKKGISRNLFAENLDIRAKNSSDT